MIPPARGVDDDRRRLHRREPRPVEHASRLVRQRRMDRNVVRLRKQLIDSRRLGARSPDLGSVHVRVVRQHPRQPEPGQLAVHRARDQPVAQQAEGLAADAVGRAVAREPPAAVADAPVGVRDLADAGQEQRQRMVGHVLDAVIRHPSDPDAALGGRVDVDVVIADAVAADDPAAPHPLDDPPRDRLQVDDHGVGIAAGGGDVGGIGGPLYLQGRDRRQDRPLLLVCLEPVVDDGYPILQSGPPPRTLAWPPGTINGIL